MLERFNFFDIYAYLIPGLLILGLAWLPYLMLGALPEVGVPEGLVVVVVAYVLGHVLQAFAKELWSSEVSWLNKKRVYPTSALLADHDTVLSYDMKAQLKRHIANHFHIAFTQPGAVEDAWHLCRTTLKARKAASYVEQYHGMYSFMKGAATAFAYATPYYVGWTIGARQNLGEYVFDVPMWGVLGFIVLVIFILVIKRMRWWALIFLAIPVTLVIAMRLAWTIRYACKVLLVAAIVVMVLRQAQSFFRLFLPPKQTDASAPKQTDASAPKQTDANALAKAAYERHITRFSLAVAALVGGILLGRQTANSLGPVLLLFAGIAWIVAVQCAGAYHSFSRDFAAAIYRDYWAVVSGAEFKKNPTSDSEDRNSEDD